MYEATVDDIAAHQAAQSQGLTGCPMHARQESPAMVHATDELVFPQRKRAVTAYTTGETGETEFHLYYGEQDITFDEPDLIAFGEGLATHDRFVAQTATTWGPGYTWARIQPLLTHLVDEGILQRAATYEATPLRFQGVQPSPLPPAQTTVPRTWFECEDIMRELTGQPLEMGYLELVIPVYRIAHVTVDAEGRQVGEANVFPAPLRLDVPTEWRSCPYPGSRYHDTLPMNATALRSMNKYWKAAMVALHAIREAYLRRCPRLRQGWTVGELQRFTTLILTVPTYLLMRPQQRVENGQLHPVLAALFRMTDGVRMTMHRMLFTSNNAPALPPDAPMTSAEIYAYAERNTVFLSDHGVCAGPRSLIEEFLQVLVDGKPVADADAVTLDPQVQEALRVLDAVFDYGLSALQAYAVVFSLWPTMCQTYERLLALLWAWPDEDVAAVRAWRTRLQPSVHFLRTATRLGTPEKRQRHAHVYADMYAQCTRALGAATGEATLAACIAPQQMPQHTQATAQLRTALRQRLPERTAMAEAALEQLVAVCSEYLQQEQAIVQAAEKIQQRINGLLERTPPTRALTAADLALHYRLVALHYKPQELRDIGGRLPYLVAELEDMLALRITVTSAAIAVTEPAAL